MGFDRLLGQMGLGVWERATVARLRWSCTAMSPAGFLALFLLLYLQIVVSDRTNHLMISPSSLSASAVLPWIFHRAIARSR